MASDPFLHGRAATPGASHPDWRDSTESRSAASSQQAPDDAPSHAFAEAMERLGEVKEYIAYYVSAKLDGYKVAARNIAIYAALGILAAMAGVTVVVMAVVLLMLGAANGIGSLCRWAFGPHWAWIGPVFIGLLVLGVMAGGVILGLKWMTRTTHRKLVSKYEDRQRRQRVAYGYDVEQRAAAERGGQPIK